MSPAKLKSTNKLLDKNQEIQEDSFEKSCISRQNNDSMSIKNNSRKSSNDEISSKKDSENKKI